MWNARTCEVWSMRCIDMECGMSGMRLFLDLELELGFFCRITIVISGRQARKTEVTQSRFEQTKYLFAERRVTAFEKLHQSRSGFLLSVPLSCRRERGTRDFESDGRIDILAEDNINAASCFPSQTWPARQTRKSTRATLKYLRSPLFPLPRVSRLTLNSLRNVTKRRRCGNSTAIRRQKNRTYHNGMRRARAIVETLRQFFDVQSTGSSIAIPPLRLAAELRRFLERPSSSLYLPTYPGDLLVIIDFTIMHCSVEN